MARAVSARLTVAEGRRFAFPVGGVMLALGGLAVWRGAHVAPWILGTLGGALVVAGVVAPTRLGPVERGWSRLAVAISTVTTPVILGILYFGVLTPVAVLARLVGHNALVRPRSATSAWVRRDAGARRSDLERQF